MTELHRDSPFFVVGLTPLIKNYPIGEMFFYLKKGEHFFFLFTFNKNNLSNNVIKSTKTDDNKP